MTMTLQARLAEAIDALHLLRTGQAVVEVTDQNGEKIRYAVANRDDLRDYISELRAEIAGTSRANGPMRFYF